ncbi:DMT family transporter [Chishuiella sp.]|uniref:DMT family transporter n=1 Tax=Chishuiella sp. TaxID=1969467 RepID=UPI0028A5A09C|nr:EamA family transporter [Chishuiella sp.]
MKSNLNILIAFVAVICLATGGIFVKLCSLLPINIAFYRILFAEIILLPFVYNDLKNVSKQFWIIILFSGVFLAMDLILWNKSFSYTTVANANLFVNLVPFTTIPLSYFFFKEKIRKPFLIGLLITLFGVLVLMSKNLQGQGNIKGDGLAFTASIFYGLFLISVYKVRLKIKISTLMFISGLGSLPILALGIFTIEKFQLPTTTSDILFLVGLTLFSQLLGQGLLSYSMKKISITLSSIIILTQPIFSAIYAFVIFHESLTKIEILGIVIILFGVYIGKKDKLNFKLDILKKNYSLRKIKHS